MDYGTVKYPKVHRIYMYVYVEVLTTYGEDDNFSKKICSSCDSFCFIERADHNIYCTSIL